MISGTLICINWTSAIFTGETSLLQKRAAELKTLAGASGHGPCASVSTPQASPLWAAELIVEGDAIFRNLAFLRNLKDYLFRMPSCGIQSQSSPSHPRSPQPRGFETRRFENSRSRHEAAGRARHVLHARRRFIEGHPPWRRNRGQVIPRQFAGARASAIPWLISRCGSYI